MDLTNIDFEIAKVIKTMYYMLNEARIRNNETDENYVNFRILTDYAFIYGKLSSLIQFKYNKNVKGKFIDKLIATHFDLDFDEDGENEVSLIRILRNEISHYFDDISNEIAMKNWDRKMAVYIDARIDEKVSILINFIGGIIGGVNNEA